MPKITILTVGKAKEPYCKQAIEVYADRLQKKHVVFDSIPQSTKEKETQALLKRIEGFSGLIVCLHEHGKQFSSVEFAAFLKKNLELPILYIMGGPDGIGEAVLLKSHIRLSLSAMTMPHELAQVVLLEQLYRAFTILDGKTYHRA
ncbi:MAG TPA: 23S rRNA (pseudouridine(1915)-N(3))-methyltransferase RlmH [Acidobacteriota bacterium]|nr:23S rRNA (pseudouridine(1915)-N(3))-methyltransferase RlmH [Acidobacteriota bacterium]